MRTNPGAFLLALLSLAALPVSAAEPLGRLFMTAGQRQALDALREPGGELLTDASRLQQPETVAPDSPVVLNGVVRRSRGPDTVWVNGSRTGAADTRIRVRKGPDATNRVTLEAAADGSSVRLKPGQYWEPATGHVANCYGCSSPARPAEITPAPAEATAEKP